MTVEFFQPSDANRYTVAADTTRLRALWAREANAHANAGRSMVGAVERANEAVDKAIRRAKRKGRR